MLSDKFRSEARREVYVTPTAYLELIQTFQTLLARKRTEIDRTFVSAMTTVLSSSWRRRRASR